MEYRKFETFEAFWPYYLSEHASTLNRRLHFIGTSLVIALAFAALAEPSVLIAIPLVGYGFAWAGHFIIERNRPATLKHPLWSLFGDFRMFGLMLIGRLEPHLERAGVR